MASVYKDQARTINLFPRKKILVLGDILVDKYIRGEATRISPEAPVVVVNVKDEKYFPGGASNVANNLASLNASVSLYGVIGNDIVGKRFLNDLNGLNINTDWVAIDKTKSTIVKTRVIANHQNLIRFDYEQKQELSKDIEKTLIGAIKKNIEMFDAVIISDYDKGSLSHSLVRKVISISHRAGKKVLVGPKPSNIKHYIGSDIISLNRSEAIKSCEFLGLKKITSIEKAGKFLLKKIKLDALLITLSEKGMLLTEKNHQTIVPTFAKEVFDVTGAGDTVLAVFSLSIAAGADYAMAARIANKAAGIVVGKLGTATATRQELKESLKE